MAVVDPVIEVHLPAAEWRAALADAARRSLAARPPWLEPVWFYDERGSELFDRITGLAEYYPTRVERALLVAHAEEIAAIGADTLIELGSGTSDKTTLLIDAMLGAGTLRRYVPLDVSEETLRAAAGALAHRYPGLDVHGVVGDFHRHLAATRLGDRRLVAFLGSTIGNLPPVARRRFLFDLDSVLDHGDRLLLGIDLVKDPASLVTAYDDPGGVTAEFNRNALRVLNRSLGTDFDPDAFEHVAIWDARQRWIEMRLRARWDQEVIVPGLEAPLRLRAGEDLRTEISAKFTVEGVTAELWEAGFVVERSFVSEGEEFALVLAHTYC